MTTLRQHAENYLALRRSLGFKLGEPGRLLFGFTRYFEDAGASHLTIDLALAWATLPVEAAPSWYWLRLSVVRGFAAYLHAIDPQHQAVPADLLPRRFRRPTPYPFTGSDVAALMRAAGARRPPLHAATYQTLIGLLAVTGLRTGETYQLDRDHVDLPAANLTVVGAKYGKSRELALRPGTVRALGSYAALRDQLCPRPSAPSFFVSAAGNRLIPSNVDKVFARLARTAGLQPRSARCRPCAKDLRH